MLDRTTREMKSFWICLYQKSLCFPTTRYNYCLNPYYQLLKYLPNLYPRDSKNTLRYNYYLNPYYQPLKYMPHLNPRGSKNHYRGRP